MKKMSDRDVINGLTAMANVYKEEHLDECLAVVERAIEAVRAMRADGCEGCKYSEKDEYEMPCLACRRNKLDYWREK